MCRRRYGDIISQHIVLAFAVAVSRSIAVPRCAARLPGVELAALVENLGGDGGRYPVRGVVIAHNEEHLSFARSRRRNIERAAIVNVLRGKAVVVDLCNGDIRIGAEYLFRREGVFRRFIEQQCGCRRDLFHRHRHRDGDRSRVLRPAVGCGERDFGSAFAQARYHAILRDRGDIGGVALPHCAFGRNGCAALRKFIGEIRRIGARFGGNFRDVRLDFQHGIEVGCLTAPYGDIAVFNVEVFGIEPGGIEFIGQFEVFHRRFRAVEHGYAVIVDTRIAFQPDPAQICSIFGYGDDIFKGELRIARTAFRIIRVRVRRKQTRLLPSFAARRADHDAVAHGDSSHARKDEAVVGERITARRDVEPAVFDSRAALGDRRQCGRPYIVCRQSCHQFEIFDERSFAQIAEDTRSAGVVYGDGVPHAVERAHKTDLCDAVRNSHTKATGCKHLAIGRHYGDIISQHIVLAFAVTVSIAIAARTFCTARLPGVELAARIERIGCQNQGLDITVVRASHRKGAFAERDGREIDAAALQNGIAANFFRIHGLQVVACRHVDTESGKHLRRRGLAVRHVFEHEHAGGAVRVVDIRIFHFDHALYGTICDALLHIFAPYLYGAGRIRRERAVFDGGDLCIGSVPCDLRGRENLRVFINFDSVFARVFESLPVHVAIPTVHGSFRAGVHGDFDIRIDRYGNVFGHARAAVTVPYRGDGERRFAHGDGRYRAVGRGGGDGRVFRLERNGGVSRVVIEKIDVRRHAHGTADQRQRYFRNVRFQGGDRAGVGHDDGAVGRSAVRGGGDARLARADGGNGAALHGGHGGVRRSPLHRVGSRLAVRINGGGEDFAAVALHIERRFAHRYGVNGLMFRFIVFVARRHHEQRQHKHRRHQQAAQSFCFHIFTSPYSVRRRVWQRNRS